MNSKVLFSILAVMLFSLTVSSVSAYAMTGMTGMSTTKTSEATVNEQTTVTLSGEDSTDPHFQAISYLWQQLSGEPVVLSSTSDQDISFTTPAVDPGQVKDLKFSLIVTNPQGLTSITAFTLHVIHNNHPPVVTTDHELTVMAGSPMTLMATATDPDGDTMTYAWTQDGGSSVSLSNPTELTTMFTAPAIAGNNTTLHFTITATDPYGGVGSDSVLVHVISASVYKLASVDCGPILRSHEGGSATLVEAIDNPSNAALTYQWNQVSGMPLQISSTTDASPTISLPTGSGGSVFAFQVTLSQDGSIVGNCEQYVYAAYPEPGGAPTADAGPDQVVPAMSQVQLDGTNSTGGYLKFSWVQISGEPVQLLNANAVKPMFTAPDVALGQTKDLVFSNTVSNSFGKDAAIVHITVVNPSSPPTAVITIK
ncbi:MAG: PKD domain-containing protein [Nitrosotalea sp.]